MSSTPPQERGTGRGWLRDRATRPRAYATLRRDRRALTAIVMISAVGVFAVGAPLFAASTGHAYDGTYPRTGLDPTGRPVGPGHRFWLGADQLGRDVLVRAAYGARVSMAVALAATLLAAVLGVTVGLVSGFAGRPADTVLARFMDLVLSLPYILVAIVLATTFRLTSVAASLILTTLTIGFFSFATIGRVVRAKVISLKEQEFITAAKALGAGRTRIMFVDLLPNVTTEVTVLASLTVPMAVMFEASMSYLGVGVRPPMPSWGSMLGESGEVFGSAWWLLAVPGGLLLMMTLSCTLLADAVRHALMPGDVPGRGGR
ncbi:MAG TPA: ABC transporter permease [Actinomadura sp.]|nr:ABC transporter permease [Actinomadura sp.]